MKIDNFQIRERQTASLYTHKFPNLLPQVKIGMRHGCSDSTKNKIKGKVQTSSNVLLLIVGGYQ